MVRKISNQEVAIILSLDDSEEEDALSVVTYVPKDCDLDRDTLDELLNVTTSGRYGFYRRGRRSTPCRCKD
jgi:hypothetical protein